MSAAVLCGPVLILYCVVLFSIHTHVLCGPVFKYLNSHTHCARYIFEALARTLTAKRRRSFLSNRRVAQTALSHARAGRRALPMHSMASLAPVNAPVSFHRCTHPYRTAQIAFHNRSCQHSRVASQHGQIDATRMHTCMHAMYPSPPARSLPPVFVPENLSSGRQMPPHATATTWMIKYGHRDASYAHEQLRPLFGELLLRNQALVEHSFELSDHCDRRLRR